MNPPRVAVAGCGAIASRFHIPILAASPHCQLVALADSDNTRHTSLQKLAPNATLYEDWQTLLAATQLDALVICLPPSLHAPCGLAALERNLHLYIEKPLASSIAEAQSLASAARPGRVNMVGFNFRFHPAILAFRDQLHRGRIGTPSILRTTFTTPAATQSSWRLAPNSGGALLDLAIHHIDLYRFLLNDPIVDLSRLPQSPDPTYSILQCRTQSGILIEGAFSLNTTNLFRLEAFGPNGSLSYERYLDTAPIFRPTGHHWTRAGKILRALHALHPSNLIHGPGHEPSFTNSLHAFLAAIQAGQSIQPDFNDGLAAQQLLEQSNA